MDATREFDIVSPAFHSDQLPTLDPMRAEGAVAGVRGATPRPRVVRRS